MCDISCSKIKAIYKTPRCNLLLGLTCTSQDMESRSIRGGFIFIYTGSKLCQ